MDTRKFRTRTEIIERANGKRDGIWEIALDIGYSAVKCFSPNSIICFPSYAKRVPDDFQFVAGAPASSILYRDLDNGQTWLVGEVAQNTMKSGDTSDSESALYGRERYYSDMYKVIADVGLGLASRSNKYGQPDINDKIVIQTGLPERYMDDESDLKDALSGSRRFALCVGAGNWETFSFNISTDDIYVMSQPKGTLLSVCIDKNGHFLPEAKEYLSSNVLVFDPGFGTLDLFSISSGAVGPGETYADLGMKRVLQETAKLIKEHYDVVIPVPAMQKYLETGKVRYFDRKKITSKEYDFGELLAVANVQVCEEAINRMINSVNLVDYEYMIVTGGTGAAWLNIIKDRLSGIDSLRILCGNQNDALPFVYSNVRGYYYYRHSKLLKK